MKNHYSRLCLILGDQLNAKHSWFQKKDANTLYVIAELHQEANYEKHHKQKIAAFFAAMQGFANALEKAGHHVLHLTLDDTKKFNDLPALLAYLIDKFDVTAFAYQQPDEYRLHSQLIDFCQTLSIDSECVGTEHFYLSHQQLSKDFSANKRHQMEAFYRRMRKRFDVLMQGDKPLGGQWNFDANNRNKLKTDDIKHIPKPLLFANDVRAILQRIEHHNIATMGECDGFLPWPVTRKQSLALLTHFCKHALPLFGTFQDAMTGKLNKNQQAQQWSLYHSRLSFAMNSKMLSPQLVVNTVIKHYQQHGQKQNITLSQVEGFVRQIIGWREFVRGIYWANMPNYKTLNALKAKRELPTWFWNGDTKMHCQQQAIGQSLQFAYAHHIQRLMITGNFCLLAGINPSEVDAWYMGIYIDAIEWVELPNTRGMSQFADGGIVGSKAYAASGNYVNKMSDYCSDCDYNVKSITEDNACPFNALYWHFMANNEESFAQNPRNKMVYANWHKKPKDQQQLILQKAQKNLKNINQL